MPRDQRTYITVHDGLPEHPKVEGLSDAAFRLLIECWCYCSRNLTDGRITRPAWEKRGTKKAREELVAAALAILQDDLSIEMHDYTEHQRTAAEVEELRQKRASAGRKGGLAKASNGLASAIAKPKQINGKHVAESDTDTKEIKDSSSPIADATDDQEIREDVERLCTLLADRIEANGSKRPTINRNWRTQCRLLLDRDGRTEQQVRAAIEWCQQDEFWMTNVLSMPTLRERYDQLRLKAQQDAAKAPRTVQAVPTYTPPPPPPEIEDDAQACARWYAEHRANHQRSA